MYVPDETLKRKSFPLQVEEDIRMVDEMEIFKDDHKLTRNFTVNVEPFFIIDKICLISTRTLFLLMFCNFCDRK